jgi:MATE family multidrug resistance protein
MIAFVPLIGVSIAASVLVGQHLTKTGPVNAARAARTSLAIALVYSCLWACVYLGAPQWLMSLYQYTQSDMPENVAGAGAMLADLSRSEADSRQAMDAAIILLRFVAAYVIFDSVQVVLAGVLRGAGDTWYVLVATSSASAIALFAGILFEQEENGLLYWWYVIMGWVWLMALFMTIRFLQGVWKSKRLVEHEESLLAD